MNSTYIKIFGYLSIILLIIFLWSSYNTAKRDRDILQQNVIALTDSVRVIKHTNNAIQYEKAVLIKQSSELSDSLRKELKKTKSQLIYQSTIDGNVEMQPQEQFSKIFWSDSNITIPFDFSNKRFHLLGETQFHIDTFNSNIKIFDPIIRIKQNSYLLELTVQVKRNKQGVILSSVSSPDTSLKLKTLDTFFIDEFAPVSKPLKNKRVSIGPQIGFGFSKGFDPAVYIGIGVQYSIIAF